MGPPPTERHRAGSRSGRQEIASGGEDGSLWLWDLATGKEIRELPRLKYEIYSIAFAPDSKTFAAADERRAWIWECRAAEKLTGFRHHVRATSPAWLSRPTARRWPRAAPAAAYAFGT